MLLPNPWSTWTSALPSAKSLKELAGAKGLLDEGLQENAISGLQRAYGEVQGMWGAQIGALEDLIVEPAKEWLAGAGAAALGAIGVVAPVPFVGWITAAASLVAGVIRYVASAMTPQYAPGCTTPGRPFDGIPATYDRDVDTDAVRIALALPKRVSLHETMRPPVANFEYFPSKGDRCKAHGGRIRIKPDGDRGTFTPGGIAYMGWQVVPQKGASYTQPIISPSCLAAHRSLWSSLFGDGGLMWSVDPVRLIKEWEAHSSFQVKYAKNAFGALRLGAALLTGNGSYWVRVESSRWGPGLVFDRGTLWEHSRVVDSGPRYIPMVCHEAIVALESLLEHQKAMTRTISAAYAMPEQPGWNLHSEELTKTRGELIANSGGVDLDRVGDSVFRELLKETRKVKQVKLGFAVPARPTKNVNIVLPQGGGGVSRPGSIALPVISSAAAILAITMRKGWMK